MLGLKLHGDHFTVEPCIPSQWPGYRVVYRHGERQTAYHITVENRTGAGRPDGAVPPGRFGCVAAVELDGAPLQGCRVPLADDGQRHEVRVVIGASPAESPVAGGQEKA